MISWVLVTKNCLPSLKLSSVRKPKEKCKIKSQHECRRFSCTEWPPWPMPGAGETQRQMKPLLDPKKQASGLLKWLPSPVCLPIARAGKKQCYLSRREETKQRVSFINVKQESPTPQIHFHFSRSPITIFCVSATKLK